MWLAHSAPPQNPTRGPQPYGEHARNVWTRAISAADEMFAFARGPAATDLLSMQNAISIASVFHDLGKLDAKNQAVLNAGRGARLPPECDHIEAGVAHTLAEAHRNIASAWLIRAHHGPGLPDRASEKFMPFGPLRGRRDRKNSDAEFHRTIVERTDRGLPRFLERHFEAWPDSPKVTPGSDLHGLSIRLALSCLVDADHYDTAAWDQPPALLKRLSCDWDQLLKRLDSYVEGLEKRDPERDALRKMLFDHAGVADVSCDLLACEAAVGLGKTTAVIRWLLRKAQQLALRRLIIVAPYTNILRQTARTLRAALCRTPEEAELWITEHHHRADFVDQSARQYAALWEAPIVLTTAVQFFETLASNHPGSLRKLHRLPGSGLFIDETHAALPASHWPQAWEWLKELSGHWTCPAVFASGSMFRFWEQPQLVRSPQTLPDLTPAPVSEACQRAEPSRIRFESLNAISHEELCQLLQVDINKGSSPCLCILNTVQTAAVIACRLAKGLDGIDALAENCRRPLSRRRVLHLSTALTPRDRELVLKEIEKRTKESRTDWILVATSCVEAGVDLDFQRGYRERSSVSSFIQTSGRINRHGSRKSAALFDFQLLANDSITAHPQFKISRDVFEQLWPAMLANSKTPSELVTLSLQLEFDRSGGVSESLCKLEQQRNYPEVAIEGRVIDSDTRTVVVESCVAERVKAGKRIRAEILLKHSVQLWSKKINLLGMEPTRPGSDLYVWSSRYDPQLIGVMQGILPLTLGTVAPGILLVENHE